MFCPNCGANIADASVVCLQCGNSIIPQPASQPLPVAKTDGKATASLILGILSVVLCLNVFTGIPAIILGHLSRSRINKSRGHLKGDGMALAGLIMGYLSIALFIPFILIVAAIAIPNLIRERETVNESSSVATVRTVDSAQVQYQSEYPDVGYAPDLASLGGDCKNMTAEHACLITPPLADSSCTGTHWCVKNGYQYILQADWQRPHQQFVVTAIPLEPGKSGQKNYCSTSDAVVRSEPSTSRTTPYTAEQCGGLTPLGY